MGLIFYTVMGEGRGHAARARAMVEHLRGRHRIVLYTSFDALDFLRAEYGDDPEVEVREIPGVKFHYTNGKLDLRKTIKQGLALWWNRRSAAGAIAADMDREKPSLLVTDFEPLGPRAARSRETPVLSLDHQHFMTAYDLSSLPARLRRWAKVMSWSIPLFDIRQQRSVISAFYKPALKPKWKDAVQVGPLLRPAVRNHQPTTGDHVLTYLRKATPQRVVDMLAQLSQPTGRMPVRIYGLGERPPQGGATFHPIDEQTFLEDLATCDTVICAAGNQLLGEALYYGKPVFALAEWNHHEQCINACFLKELGAGDWAPLEKVAPADLEGFLENRETYRQDLAASGLEFDGTQAAADAIEAMLSGAAPSRG